VWVDPVNIMRDYNLADNKTSSVATLFSTNLKAPIGPIAPKVPINTIPSLPKILPPG
jgi:hypothetical protein